MRILIAEDDLTSRSILAAILKKWGYEPVVTRDGGAAWDALQRPDAPKLVLLDWNMPELDGPDVCRRLRERESSDPPYVILLTGRGETADIVIGLDAGANDYIAKPYDTAELQARIQVGRRMLELQARLIEARDALEHQATHDPLTGIWNRRAILDRLAAELSRVRRDGGSLSVGMLDIDHFKRINDGHGHQVGDEVLVGFCGRVQAQLRQHDCLGRYGGEEFLVIAAGRGGTDDESLYRRLCAQVAETRIATSVGELAVTVSIGVAHVTGPSAVDGLLAAADAALYRAKAAGRNRVVSDLLPPGAVA
jgi:diguanylate cyclase (GGDEF)-like protein